MSDAFVLQGDALEVLRGIEADTFEAVVTDPPYGLGREPSPEELTRIVRAWALGEHVPVTGRGFMGRSWDAFVPGSAIWREVWRVLKPGGHVLAFAGSRTVDHWAARDTDSQPTLPTLEQWDALRGLLGFGDEMDAEVLRLNLRKGEPGDAWKDRPVTGRVAEWRDRANYALTSRDGLRRDVAVNPEAAAWAGWGTALKPAHEPIIMARKPLAGTVAANVLEHGTGAINVDGCRVGEESTRRAHNGKRAGVALNSARDGSMAGAAGVTGSDVGRWPANVILDEAAGAVLDAQSGERTSGTRAAGVRKGLGYHGAKGDGGPAVEGSSGGASRFFYCPKASRAERNAGAPDGNKHPTVKPIALMRWLVRLVTPPGGAVLDPFTGSGTTGAAAVLEGFDFVGVELDAEHVALAEARIAHWRKAAT